MTQSPILRSKEMVWDEFDHRGGQQVLSIYGNSFTIAEKMLLLMDLIDLIVGKVGQGAMTVSFE